VATPSAPSPAPPPRPAWARHLDALALAAAAVLGRVLRRPSDAELQALARRDRRAAPVPVPTLRALGYDDPLGDGRAAFARGDHAEALHCFGQVIAAHPQSPWGWHGRGDALLGLGDPAAADASYARAAALAPREGIHLGGRANCARASGDAAAAARWWEAALALDPSLTWMRDGRPPPVRGPGAGG
jgi:tetratricopeptide (TPR) repeat protein